MGASAYRCHTAMLPAQLPASAMPVVQQPLVHAQQQLPVASQLAPPLAPTILGQQMSAVPAHNTVIPSTVGAQSLRVQQPVPCIGVVHQQPLVAWPPTAHQIWNLKQSAAGIAAIQKMNYEWKQELASEGIDTDKYRYMEIPSILSPIDRSKIKEKIPLRIKQRHIQYMKEALSSPAAALHAGGVAHPVSAAPGAAVAIATAGH